MDESFGKIPSRIFGNVENEVEDKSIEPAWKNLGLKPWFVEHLQKLHFSIPTVIQEKCIPQTIKGKDILGMSQTGSGKTACFAIPIIQDLEKDMFGVFALVLTPTRELAIQIGTHFRALSGHMHLRVSLLVGGMSRLQQAEMLDTKPHVVVATPGRVEELIREIPDAKYFRRIRYLVFDEADRMLATEFAFDVEKIVKATNPNRQTLLYSATMNNTVKKLAKIALSKSPDDVFIYDACKLYTTADNLAQYYIFIPRIVKDCYLFALLKKIQDQSKTAMVFFCSIKDCETCMLTVRKLGIKCDSLHSSKGQRDRSIALRRFSNRSITALFSTDVGNRGLDIPSVALVINYDLPETVEKYVHRVGRTARAGRIGEAIALISQYEVKRVKEIEKATKVEMKKYKDDCIADPEKVESVIYDIAEKRCQAKIDLIESGFLFKHAANAKSKKDSKRKTELLRLHYEKKYNDLLKLRGKAEKINEETPSEIEKPKPSENHVPEKSHGGINLLRKRKRNSSFKKNKK